VDDAVAVKVTDTRAHLPQPVACGLLGEVAVELEVVEEGVVGAQFQ
jgi:hypothetical protein